MTADRDPMYVQTQPVVSYSVAATAILLHLIATKHSKSFGDFKFANSKKGRSDKKFNRSNRQFSELFKKLNRKTWNKILAGKKSITLQQLDTVLKVLQVGDTVFFELVDTIKYYLVSKNIPIVSKDLKTATLLDNFDYKDTLVDWLLVSNFGDGSDENDDTLIILTPLTVQTVFAVLEDSMIAAQFLDDLDNSDCDVCNGCDECDSADHADDTHAFEDNDASASEDDDDDYDDDSDYDDQDDDDHESSETLTGKNRISNLDQLRSWIDSMSRVSSTSSGDLDKQDPEVVSKEDSDAALLDVLAIFTPKAEAKGEELDKQDTQDALGFRPSELQKLANLMRADSKIRLEKLAHQILNETEISEEENTDQTQASSVYESEQGSTAFDFLRSSGWFKTFADTYLEQLGSNTENSDAHKKSQEQQKFMEEYSARLLESFFKKPKI